LIILFKLKKLTYHSIF